MANDLELLNKARARDKGAMEMLLGQLQPSVYRFGLSMCRNEEDARDILQETLMAMAQNIGTFRGESSLSTWAFTIARSHCIKKRRKSKFAPAGWQPLNAVELSSDETPHTTYTHRELESGLNNTLAALEHKYREVFILRDIEGQSAEEVAKILGLSVAAVKSRLHRARSMVRERMAPLLASAPDVPPGGGACEDIAHRFSEYLEGEITGSVCDSLKHHVENCPRCGEVCETLKRTLDICRNAGATRARVPVEVQKRVQILIEQIWKAKETKT